MQIYASSELIMISGYLHPDYADSLAEFGTPFELPRCKGWILKRSIPGFPYRDAMGCYPLFACEDWSNLHAALEDLGSDIVSLALVTDPFGKYTFSYLKECFDVVIPFKEHYVLDLSQPLKAIVTRHHRYYANKALRSIYVERCIEPIRYLDEWMNFYSVLTQKHGLRGIKAFSKTAFTKQLSVPGIVMFRALHQSGPVGAHLWYIQEEVGYSHLAACSATGYDLMASYALYSSAIEYFVNKLHWLDLGAGAGAMSNDTDGLSRFKSGWSTGARTSFFCGRIYNKRRYAEITKAKGISVTDYFPVYRKGEFY
jgi:hypothetical protein